MMGRSHSATRRRKVPFCLCSLVGRCPWAHVTFWLSACSVQTCLLSLPPLWGASWVARRCSILFPAHGADHGCCPCDQSSGPFHFCSTSVTRGITVLNHPHPSETGKAVHSEPARQGVSPRPCDRRTPTGGQGTGSFTGEEEDSSRGALTGAVAWGSCGGPTRSGVPCMLGQGARWLSPVSPKLKTETKVARRSVINQILDAFGVAGGSHSAS